MTIYIAARDLSGFVIGTHQFIIVVVESSPHPEPKLGATKVKAKYLGNGKLGYVIGAQNRGDLVVEYFEKSDYQATLEYFDKSKRGFFSDFDTEAHKVTFPGLNGDEAARKIFELVDNYSINQKMDKIPYPTVGWGINSNSWAQTIIELAGGRAVENMKGLDKSSDKRIPKTYFEPYCPVNPRPRLNK